MPTDDVDPPADPDESGDRPDALPPGEPGPEGIPPPASEPALDHHGSWRRRLAAVVRFDVGEQIDLGRFLARWIALGAAVGVLAGLASAGFLVTLDWATETRIEQPWLLWLLPVAGLVVGLAYHHLGGDSARGNNLIIDEIHAPSRWVPRRMAPLVYGGTIVTHLFGGSAGREGTAIQMSGSLTDALARLLRLGPTDRRLLLVAAIAGGFGSVFGVPLAGAVFAFEVQAVGRLRYDALVPAVVASVVGDRVVEWLGVDHTPTPTIGGVELGPDLLAKLVLVGLACGLVALVFVEATHAVKRLMAARVAYEPLRPFLGGLAVIALTFAVGSRDYLGLSLPLAGDAFTDVASVALFAFALKLVFTAVTLGTGFQGGEVTPLFIIGVTLGATLARALGVDGPLLPAVGYVAVFGAAANTPLACTVMGLELFGVDAAVPLLIVCSIAYVTSGHRGIYASQRLEVAKHRVAEPPPVSPDRLADEADRRRARRRRLNPPGSP